MKKKNKIKNIILFLIKWRYVVALLIFALLVAFKIHGSSIAEYNKMFEKTAEYNAESIILGESRPVRSDEWLVHTPYYMSQTYNDFEKDSNMMSLDGQDMIISTDAPVKNLLAVAKPFTWGYMLLGNEYGLSWHWCSKLILLILMSYEFCFIVTRKNKKIALLGAVLISFSPLTQWWFMSSMVDVFVFGMATFVVGYYLFVAKTNWKKNLMMVLAPLAIMAYVLALFPALQIPVAMFLIAMFVVVLVRDKDEILFNKWVGMRLGAIVAATGALLLYMYLGSKNAISLVGGTVYPGQRFETGGGNVISDLFTGITNFTLPFKDITFVNNCEVSTFIQFAPIFLILYPVIYKKAKRDKNLIVGNTLVICIAVAVVFMLAGFPELLAKITLFSNVNRMVMVYGFMATVFTLWGIDIIWRRRILTKKQILLTLAIYGGLYVCFVGKAELTYLRWWQYGIIIVGLLVLSYLMLTGRQKLFIGGILVLAMVSSATINPIARGIKPVVGHPLEQKISEIAASDKEAYWLAVNNNLLASLGVINGARVLDMVNFYPDFPKWELIDPEKKSEDIYNRYAHILVSLTEDKTKIEIGPTQDVVALTLSCKDVTKLGVKYLLVGGELDACKSEYKNIYEDTEGKYYIYERVKHE